MCLGILERIAVDWNRDAAPIRRLNPPYFNKIDKIDVLGGSPLAIAGATIWPSCLGARR